MKYETDRRLTLDAMITKADRKLWLRLLVLQRVLVLATCSSINGDSATTVSVADDETIVAPPKVVKAHRRFPSYFIKMTPHFVNTTETDVTATVGRNVFLPCSVRHLGDRTVSWIRRPGHGGFDVLTVGRMPYTMDGKFQPMHLDSSESWNLQIKDVRLEDAGVYECQVSTSPKIGRHIILSVIESRARIVGSPVLYVNQGGTLRLICELSGPLSGNEFIFWYKNGKVLNYDAELKRRMEISMNSSMLSKYDDRKSQPAKHHSTNNADAKALLPVSKRIESRLVVTAIGASDSGNYTCQPSNALSDSIQVFVIINNDLPAAMQDSVMEISSTTTGNNELSSTAIIVLLLATSLLVAR